MTYHPAPYDQISTHIDDPSKFINVLYRALLEARPYFPGATNYIGACIDSLMEPLEDIGAIREFDE
jgi:hypothetical protein